MKDLFFWNKNEAEETIEFIHDRLEKNKAISMADIYKFVGYTVVPKDHTFGWKNLEELVIEETHDCSLNSLLYLVKLPEEEVI